MKTQIPTSRMVANTKSRKLQNRVDFTALVSLSFLLIMFFMLSAAIKRPHFLNFSSPESSCGPVGDGFCYGENRCLTVLLNSNNSIVYYQGNLQEPIIKPSYTFYGKNGIRKVLLSLKKSSDSIAKEHGRTFGRLAIIIKPSSKSNYKNFIDILDEMAIVGVDSYAVLNDFLPGEKVLLR